MKSWVRAVVPTQCGRCGRVLERGEPVVAFTFLGMRRRLFRCPSCGDAGQIPAYLPPLPEKSPIITTAFAHIRTGLVLPFDFKVRAAGEREPGEEG